jgi:hypothetical protein
LIWALACLYHTGPVKGVEERRIEDFWPREAEKKRKREENRGVFRVFGAKNARRGRGKM